MRNIHISSDACRSQEKPFWSKPLERDSPDASRGDGPLGMDFISQAQSAEFNSQVILDQDVPGGHIPMKQILILQEFLSAYDQR